MAAPGGGAATGADIAALVRRLQGGSWIRRVAALNSVRALAGNGPEGRRQLVVAGAVPALAACLRSEVEAVEVGARFGPAGCCHEQQ